ncbi:hypothetical protein [Sphingomonas sp. 2378]|uniref:hypothetical protein n=1 Tax=Sphingomonas sp. 2378 TaxID=1219748 RepID=UPI00311ACF2B
MTNMMVNDATLPAHPGLIGRLWRGQAQLCAGLATGLIGLPIIGGQVPDMAGRPYAMTYALVALGLAMVGMTMTVRLWWWSARLSAGLAAGLIAVPLIGGRGPAMMTSGYGMAVIMLLLFAASGAVAYLVRYRS